MYDAGQPYYIVDRAVELRGLELVRICSLSHSLPLPPPLLPFFFLEVEDMASPASTLATRDINQALTPTHTQYITLYVLLS